jgi:putative chitinase
MDGTALPLAYLTSALVRAVAPACADPAGWVEPLRTACMRFEVSTRARLACFLAQVAHESGDLNTLSENLNYTVAGLRKNFPDALPAVVGGKDRPHAQAGRPMNTPLPRHLFGAPRQRREGRCIPVSRRRPYPTHGLREPQRVRGVFRPPDYRDSRDAAHEGWRGVGGRMVLAHPRLQPLADAGAFDGITRIINGGMNGADDRRSRYLSACRVLGL